MMGFDDPGANGEPQAGPFFRVGTGIVGAVEAVKDSFLIFGRNPNALIRYDEFRLVKMGRQRYFNGTASPRIFDGVPITLPLNGCGGFPSTESCTVTKFWLFVVPIGGMNCVEATSSPE